jgi:hypothetical protein
MTETKEIAGQIEYYSRAMKAPGSGKQQRGSRTRPAVGCRQSWAHRVLPGAAEQCAGAALGMM